MMKAEKILISLVAMVIGIAVAGFAFYFYQSQKAINRSQIKTISIEKAPTPTIVPSVFVTIDSPQNEAVVSSKTITVSGKTTPDATVVITTDADEDVVTPASNGSFSTTLTLADNENILEVTAITPNGAQSSAKEAVTYSTEEF